MPPSSVPHQVGRHVVDPKQSLNVARIGCSDLSSDEKSQHAPRVTTFRGGVGRSRILAPPRSSLRSGLETRALPQTEMGAGIAASPHCAERRIYRFSWS